MTEFLELVKEAPNFNAMERDELVMYAYAMFAAGAKADSENVKLRELLAKEDITFYHDLALAAQKAMEADAEKAMRVFMMKE